MPKSFEEFKAEVAADSEEHELKSVDIDMGFTPLGCVELAEQKALLMHLMINNGDYGDSILEGLLNLIDVIQDQLHEYHRFPEDIVFPYKNHESEDPDPINYKLALGSLLKELPTELLPKYLNSNEQLTRVLTKFFKDGEL